MDILGRKSHKPAPETPKAKEVKKTAPKKPAAKKVEVKKTPKLTKNVTLKPRVSEKGYSLSEQVNTYVFEVPNMTNKFDVAQAVSNQFEVEVTNVRIATIPGKAVRSYRNRGRRSVSSKRSDVRKAYVTLKQGDKLPIFAAMEESDALKETK